MQLLSLLSRGFTGIATIFLRMIREVARQQFDFAKTCVRLDLQLRTVPEEAQASPKVWLSGDRDPLSWATSTLTVPQRPV